MTNNVIARIERLVQVLREMSQEIEPELYVVSHVTLQEWRALQGTWPSENQLSEGTTGLTEEQLKTIVAKTRRFKDIIHGLASRVPGSTRATMTHQSRSDEVAPPWNEPRRDPEKQKVSERLSRSEGIGRFVMEIAGSANQQPAK